MKIMCVGCKQPVDVPDLGQPRIINTPVVSMLLIEHPEQVLCPTCKVPVVAMLTGAQMQIVAAPVPVKEQAPVILAPNGLRVN